MFRETVVVQELIHKVNLGPFTHTQVNFLHCPRRRALQLQNVYRQLAADSRFTACTAVRTTGCRHGRPRLSAWTPWCEKQLPIDLAAKRIQIEQFTASGRHLGGHMRRSMRPGRFLGRDHARTGG